MRICGYFSNVAFAGFVVLGWTYFKLWIPNEDTNILYVLAILTIVSSVTEGVVQPLRLGFEIPLNVFGKGLHIFHTGNIIINETSSVGEYCNIIGSTCLGSKDGGNGPRVI